MKQEEALNKWCPHVRVAGAKSSYNKDVQGAHVSDTFHKYFNCIGSKCMMWEPEYKLIEKNIPYVVVDGKVEVPVGWRSYGRLNADTTIIRQYVENGCGDCGLKTKETQCNV